MRTAKYDPEKAVSETFAGLKNFQRATVERVDELFRNGQRHVLVADEVGLGKTLVAKGVIVKTAQCRAREKDDLFKVVYICSNQNIARQNIQKLKINENTRVDKISDTRLSMQHLTVTEQENDAAVLAGFIQLIPLTPVTSFHVNSGRGDVNERALMFLILKELPLFSRHLPVFEQLMKDRAVSAWDDRKASFGKRIDACRGKTKKRYPDAIRSKVKNAIESDAELTASIERFLKTPEKYDNLKGIIVNKLRKIFAGISIAMLQPDLVILDEFQRFNELIMDKRSEDMQLLIDEFFGSTAHMKVLLLSATPFKLFSTAEEISEQNCEEAYDGFYKVIKFVSATDDDYNEFCSTWREYYLRLHSYSAGGETPVFRAKEKAQNALYAKVCRTERVNADDAASSAEGTSGNTALEISAADIEANIALGSLLRDIGESVPNCIEFVKSAPYLLSFMQQYKLKSKVESYFKRYPDKLKMADNKFLWVKRSLIDRYAPLPSLNARLTRLIEMSFAQKAALLLWVPPSRPYYDQQGPFKNSDGFSKFLAFSCWEMAPRMIATLMSYEAECRSIGKLSQKARVKEKKDAHYFAEDKKRFPLPRLRFSAYAEDGRGMNLLCLLYPSPFLTDIWDIKKSINDGLTLKQTESLLIKRIKGKATIFKKYQNDSNRVDERWYYMAPMLIDDSDFVCKWADQWNKKLSENNNREATEQDIKGIHKQLKALLDTLEKCRAGKTFLGKMPEDLFEILVKQALGSPAVCIYRRSRTEPGEAAALAGSFVDRLNTAESTAVIDIVYGRRKDDAVHWMNVLNYCVDGSFQAMFDEYFHMVADEQGVCESQASRTSQTLNAMTETLKFRSASYMADTYSAFAARMQGKKEKSSRIRTHFAVCFNSEKNENENATARKDSIRAAFNSPLRPFILATTSIGQEGLDFHYYCRKVVHWNLPSNPIDIEQREGRVDRYKGLAIRQSIAAKYGNMRFKTDDIWSEMFDAASSGIAEKGASELVPFWSLGNDQKAKIESIPLLYPLSRDIQNYGRLMKMRSLYRIALGQPNQQELLETLLKKTEDESTLRKFFINLSPFERVNGKNNKK